MELFTAALLFLLAPITVRGAEESAVFHDTDFAGNLSGWYHEFDLRNVINPLHSILSVFENSSKEARDIISTPTQDDDNTGLVCPQAVELKVIQDLDRLLIPIPAGLHVPIDECWFSVRHAANEKNVSLETSGGLSTAHSDYSVFKATLPDDLFECQNNSGHPISQLRLSSLKTRITPLIRSVCTELGIPDSAIRNSVGDAVPEETESDEDSQSGLVKAQWGSAYFSKISQSIHDSLELLGKATVMVLSQRVDVREDLPMEVTVRQLHSSTADHGEKHPPGECTLVGGPGVSRQSVFMEVEKILTQLLAFLAGALRSPIGLGGRALYPTKRVETGSTDFPRIRNITFAELNQSDTIPGEEWVSVGVNGEICTVSQVSNFVEVEKLILQARGGLRTVTQGRNILSFLENEGDESIRRRLANSGLHDRFPVLENRAREVLFKEKMRALRMNLAGCGSVGSDAAFDIIFVDSPAEVFYCGGFPYFEVNSTNLCSSGGLLDEDRQSGVLDTSISAFIIPVDGNRMQLFSDSMRKAELMRGEVNSEVFANSSAGSGRGSS